MRKPSFDGTRAVLAALAGVATLAVALAPAVAAAAPTTWKIDPAHSTASFTVRHLAISNVRGAFQKLEGTVELDDQDPTRSSVEAVIDASSIDTRQPNRDADLKSPNFFDVAKYPTITFKSTKVDSEGGGKLKVTGDLTMHGVTKPVVLDVDGPTPAIKDMQGAMRRGFHATTKLNRKDYGLNWNKMVEAGPVVGDEVQIELAGEMVQQPASPTAQGKAEQGQAAKKGAKR